MLLKLTGAPRRKGRGRYFASAAALALLCLTAAAPAHAVVPGGSKDKKKNQPTTGRIEVSTQPGGYPIIIDGKPAGETTDYVRPNYVRRIELEPGAHTVEIIFPNNTRWSQVFNIIAGHKNCIALVYRPRTIEIPDIAAPPCPYPVNVTAPAQVNDGDIVTFGADVGYQGQSALNYTWVVSPPAARILSGAGTPTITVDSSGLGGKRVTAILVVDDGSGERACRQTAQAATRVVGLPKLSPPRRFDEFPSVARDDDKARFDNFAVELQTSPGTTGRIVAHAGRNSRPGEADRMGRRAADYLTAKRGIDRSRLSVIDGGQRDADTFELWLVPRGAKWEDRQEVPRRPDGPRPDGRPEESAPETRGADAVRFARPTVVESGAAPDGAAHTTATAAEDDPADAQSGGKVQTLNLGDVNATVCNCGETSTAASPRGNSNAVVAVGAGLGKGVVKIFGGGKKKKK